MSILNVTNLTDNPEGMILDKYEAEFEEVEKELNITVESEEKRDFIDSQIETLIEQAEDTKGRDLLGLIDNYLVNLDYYAVVTDHQNLGLPFQSFRV